MKKLQMTTSDLTSRAFDAYSNSDDAVYKHNGKLVIATSNDKTAIIAECDTMAEINEYFEDLYAEIFAE